MAYLVFDSLNASRSTGFKGSNRSKRRQPKRRQHLVYV